MSQCWQSAALHYPRLHIAKRQAAGSSPRRGACGRLWHRRWAGRHPQGHSHTTSLFQLLLSLRRIRQRRSKPTAQRGAHSRPWLRLSAARRLRGRPRPAASRRRGPYRAPPPAAAPCAAGTACPSGCGPATSHGLLACLWSVSGSEGFRAPVKAEAARHHPLPLHAAGTACPSGCRQEDCMLAYLHRVLKHSEHPSGPSPGATTSGHFQHASLVPHVLQAAPENTHQCLQHGEGCASNAPLSLPSWPDAARSATSEACAPTERCPATSQMSV